MVSIVKALVGILLMALGGPLLVLGLVRLGWRRHGASPADLTFLHLDWIVQPQLPGWPAHMANVAMACAGLIVLAVGVAMVLRQLAGTTRHAQQQADALLIVSAFCSLAPNPLQPDLIAGSPPGFSCEPPRGMGL